jgi:serpin B
MKRLKLAASLCLVAIILSSGAATASTPEMASLVAGNNEFALALYAEVRTGMGNLFLSPYSISSALAMTYAGARGNTAAQMHDVLRFKLDDKHLHSTFDSLTEGLNRRGETGDFDLSVANALWGQRDYKFLDSFVKLNGEHYGAGLRSLDFAGDAEGARQTINSWVEEQTQNKIRDLIKPGDLTPLTSLVLTNAIYFKGRWASRFDENLTAACDFRVTADSSVSVSMMNQTRDFGYMETAELQALEIPYTSPALTMLVLLPRGIDGLDSLEQTLTADSLTAWSDRVRARRVEVSLPKFSLTSEFDLAQTLAAMGMRDAFAERLADFSGMTGTKDLYIDLVLHKAFVDVREEGTEAAAATGISMKKIGIRMPVIFRADHPFLFTIWDRATGSILFMGRLVDPEA